VTQNLFFAAKADFHCRSAFVDSAQLMGSKKLPEDPRLFVLSDSFR